MFSDGIRNTGKKIPPVFLLIFPVPILLLLLTEAYAMTKEGAVSHDKALFEILASVQDARDMQRLMEELLTPKELEDIWRRWQLLEDLYRGVPQREIVERHKMSLCKITRGAKILRNKNSVCKAVIEKQMKK